MNKRTVLAAVTACLIFGTAVANAQGAGDVGRYQAIFLSKQDALIIDTKTGNVWKWFEGASVSGAPGGSGLRYEGTAVPGKAPGEIVARNGFNYPTIQRPGGCDPLDFNKEPCR